MSTLATTHRWAEPAALADLHACRTMDDLDREFLAGVHALLPGVGAAVCLVDDAPDRFRVAATSAVDCPLQGRAFAVAADWPLAEGQRLPIRYRNHFLGELWLWSVPEGEELRLLGSALAHYGTALVNLTLNRETRQATEDYCASLQALEEGIVLFQEEDPAAITARILCLATSMAQSAAGALYVLDEVGNPESGLRLEQVLGIPDSLIAGFRSVDGRPWPACLLEAPAQLAERHTDGSLAELAPECVPPILQQMIVLPLRYHGVVAGLCLLLNPAEDGKQSRDHLGRLQSLGQLAAALLHRLRLEQQSASSHRIERELQIAETIQQRLLPDGPPRTEAYDFAWRTIAAKNIGGDYLDVLAGDDGTIHAVIADASGHGINSALLMSSFRSNYRGQVMWQEPQDLVGDLNGEVVKEVGPTGMFITAQMLDFDLAGTRLRVCTAGHCPLMIYRAVDGRIDCLPGNGPPLGFVEGIAFDTNETDLARGDVVVAFTDGISEATNADLDMFEESRLQAVVRQHADRPAAAIVDAVVRSLSEFTGRVRYEDDVSLLVVKVR
ncbi:MAG: SpoIIE family protein phosphatase [Planctomycetes bacterium]|nr:SpoIIE family protein phosphatase [Planctomycetota bacterium]